MSTHTPAPAIPREKFSALFPNDPVRAGLEDAFDHTFKRVTQEGRVYNVNHEIDGRQLQVKVKDGTEYTLVHIAYRNTPRQNAWELAEEAGNHVKAYLQAQEPSKKVRLEYEPRGWKSLWPLRPLF